MFNSIGGWADSILIISLYYCGIGLFKNNLSFPKHAGIFLMLFIPFSMSALDAVLMNNYPITAALSLLQSPIRMLITLIGGYFIAKDIYEYYGDKTEAFVFRAIFYATTIHGAIMVAQLLYPNFRDFIYRYTTNGDFRSTFDYDFRMGGLSGGTGGAILSVMESIGILIFPYIVKKSKTFFGKILNILCVLIIVSSILVCGRSGLWGSILFLPMSLYFVNAGVLSVVVRKIFFMVLSFILLLSILFVFYDQLDKDDPVSYALGRTLDTFLDFRKSGEFEDETVSVLKGHLLVPDRIKVYLVGDSENLLDTQMGRPLETDIGYVRNLWSFGVLGSLIYWFPLLSILGNFFRAFKTDKNFLVGFTIMLSFVMLFFHTKELFLYTRMLFSAYCLIIGIYIVKRDGKVLSLDQ